MQEIPFIHIKNKKLQNDSSLPDVPLLSTRLQDSTVYIFDEDGINKNKPNVSIYQKFSSIATVWIDAGPRDTDDIIDELFSGANRVVIRAALWRESSLINVRNITENELMVLYSIQEIRNGVTTNLKEAQGYVIHINQNTEFSSNDIHHFLTQIAKTKPTYVLDENIKTKEYWESFKIAGIFVPITLSEVAK